MAMSGAVPLSMRKKMDKKETESLAEEAAFVVAVTAEVQNAMPVSDKVLATEWVDKYVQGESGVLLEVQSAILQRNCKNVSELGTIQQIMNCHAGNAPVTSSAATTHMVQLESETFQLVMKQLAYDCQALRVARAKKNTWESTVYHAKLQFRVQAYQESCKAAKHFLDSNCHIFNYNKPEMMANSILAYCTDTMQKFKLDKTASVYD